MMSGDRVKATMGMTKSTSALAAAGENWLPAASPMVASSEIITSLPSNPLKSRVADQLLPSQVALWVIVVL